MPQNMRLRQQNHQLNDTQSHMQQQHSNSPANDSNCQVIHHHHQAQQQYQIHHMNQHETGQQGQQQHVQYVQDSRPYTQQTRQQQQIYTRHNAPPTPPSDDQHHSHHQHHQKVQAYSTTQMHHQTHQVNRSQTGAWVMQTAQMQQQQGEPQHDTATTTTMHNQQYQTPITSYYYDIDDGFSDILSAPATPEPNQQQQLVSENYNDYNHYLPYNQHTQQQTTTMTNHVQVDSYNNNQQQQQQQYFHHQTITQSRSSNLLAPVPYAVALSPDSSSLSTTSSSPSDHSLYQASPPMPSCQLMVKQEQPTQHYQTSLPLSPPVESPLQQQQQQQHIFTISQQHQATTSSSANSQSQNNQVVLKPINTASGPQQQQQQRPNQLVQQRPQQPPHHRSSPIHLWEFLKELLQQVELGSADATIIRWLDRQKGVFKIEDSVRVAKLWGKRKNKPKMNYDKLSRSIRQYYKKGIMKKTDRSQRLVYQFCSAYCH